MPIIHNDLQEDANNKSLLKSGAMLLDSYLYLSKINPIAMIKNQGRRYMPIGSSFNEIKRRVQCPWNNQK
ncbi:hypothetical protein KOSB73_220260 [Klebsiella grimontii]|uniref:Uncharacterized protein n=1 Tax=Klebsiella grimontii TaxID=2058152 RepID=A0A285AZL5_9ENTR|nr:hypothetical protein KOSB73_220260 [Klebsiella grimontii]